MAKAIPVVIGAIKFPTKKAAYRYCSDMLRRYRDGATVDAADTAFLRELVQGHAHAVEKIGVGIKRFFRDKAPEPSFGSFNSCFWIERTDGSRIEGMS